MSKRFGIVLLIIFLCSTYGAAEEGMYPMSEIHKLNLPERGLEIPASEIYNPDGISLIDGICRVGGCTGSFVSVDGLILTNHHCAYGAVQRASTSENDYLRNGFLAKDKSGEIEAKNYTVRITESYEDVSEEVLSAVTDDMNFYERTKAIETKIKQIEKDAEDQHPGKRAEVSEMFTGKTYVLFVYTYLKDIRLVYAPPRSIGEFGGEEDNWIWPRHTGDFSFLRAYTAPDGSSADYSPDNVPYHPKKFLQVAPEGVAEGDFVFIFGYPGRTYRHRTSYFMAHEEEIRMPRVVDLYDWLISLMKKMGENDRDVALKHSSRIKGLSNVLKNYQGKLLGLKRLDLVEKKRLEEKELMKFISADKKRNEKYGDILPAIEKLYNERRATFDSEFNLQYMRRNADLFRFAYTVYEAAIERQKKDIERESAYMDKNFSRTKNRLLLATKDYYEPTDKIVFKEFLLRLAENQQVEAVQSIIKGKEPEAAIDEFLATIYAESTLNQKEYLEQALLKSEGELKESGDPILNFAIKIYPVYKELKEIGKTRKGQSDELAARLIDVKKEFLKTDFIPDANSTLRFTFGHIRGYSPQDAVYYHPITTLDGVIEKTTGEPPFNTPPKLIELYNAKNFGRFYNTKLGGVPTAILYDMDTTGGNSGSPVMNAKGEIVGVNFDRAFEATINDYGWSQDYSRSIAVDIRYVLWVTQKFAGADYLLREMNVTE